MKDFVHLHNHTEYSLLDGACRIDRMVELAAKMEMPSLAITDHGNLFGAVEFYKACRKASIKPIIGIEAYIAPNSRRERRQIPGLKNPSFHLVLLAKNITGFQNLLRLSSESYLTGFYYKPRIDIKILKKYSEGLIGLSGCIKGEIPSAILGAHFIEPETALKKYLDIFGPEDFYLEIHDHDIAEESRVRKELLKLSLKYNLKLVATNDCHYLMAGDYEAHDRLLCIQTSKTVNERDRLKYSTDKLYFRRAEEMVSLFGQKYPGSIENTLEIADKCGFDIELGKLRLPVFETPDGESPSEYLKKMINLGFRERGLSGEAARERLRYEHSVIERAGFASYFLIVRDIIRWAKTNGIMVGPGRGSAAGSLVAYCLGITEINPLEHGLLFERFLNPDRISMPDIDMDFADTQRGRVYDYIRKKYGEDHVSQIITFGTLNPKTLMRDICRISGQSYEFADRLAKSIPTVPDITLEKALEDSPEFRELTGAGEGAKVLSYARVLEGLKRHAGIHAAGVVISSEPIINLSPLYKSRRGDEEISTQFDMYSLDEMGMLKFDLLGLRTLSVIDLALHLIAPEEKSYQALKSQLLGLDLTDSKVLALFAEGRTVGIFQFESNSMQAYLKRVGPGSFADLAVMNALYRPGPIDSGMIESFVRRRGGQEAVEYADPRLEAVLSDTLGIMVFQEQVMRVAQVIAGFTLAEADTLRKAIGKKIKNLMEDQKRSFIERAISNGTAGDVAEEIWRQMETFAGYGFNKSHAVGYAFLAFQTAYLKTYYPTEFMAAMLSLEVGDVERMPLLISECRAMGITLLPPDINYSEINFTVAGGSAIRFGLSSIKGIGASATLEIIKRRTSGPFENLLNFCARVNRVKVHRGCLEALIQSGAFDSFKSSRKAMFESINDISERGASIRADMVVGQSTILGDVLGIKEYEPVSGEGEWTKTEFLAREKSALGAFISAHPLDDYKLQIENFSNCLSRDIRDMKDGAPVKFVGIVSSVTHKKSKKGNLLHLVSFDDYIGKAEATLFDDTYQSFAGFLIPGRILAVKGKISKFKDFPAKILAGEIRPVESLSCGTLVIDYRNPREFDMTQPFGKHDRVKVQGKGYFWEVRRGQKS